ncbi:DddA-like double-stranded DNA deaminase toxin [Nocardia sp. NRRL S-836]|uniref:DddA-like double-stranded DNA deaminase toxin n=1 Tax=Nocardia sp. NRRL S-836 TaxID=1519492 RepID=UPI0006AFF6EB|nr:DddA-like double-stranded DNA deaminase toxin [Nocardia sp. NRRL S-836]KOV83749.1 hypothetical protein ADL03_19905 [Nocardia sp. NRRL S-836]
MPVTFEEVAAVLAQVEEKAGAAIATLVREPDEEHDRINDHLIQLGIGRPGASVEASKHVEVKVAWRMRQRGMDHVELVVNNELCNGTLSCSRLLPYVLGPDQTLTVHDPVRSREFRGRDVR